MKKLALVLAAALALPSAANAASFTDGGFDVGGAGAYTTIGTGGSIGAWKVTAGSVDLIGSYWQNAAGSNSVDLSGNSAGTLSQTFDTVAGVTYNVSFMLAGNPDGGNLGKAVDVSATGATSQSFSFGPPLGTLSAMNWTPFTYTFTATGGSTTLSFASAINSPYGPALDSVSISSVPETATWGMMILGMGFIGGALRRRQRTKVSFA